MNKTKSVRQGQDQTMTMKNLKIYRVVFSDHSETVVSARKLAGAKRKAEVVRVAFKWETEVVLVKEVGR